jgi:hypothetical protein
MAGNLKVGGMSFSFVALQVFIGSLALNVVSSLQTWETLPTAALTSIFWS